MIFIYKRNEETNKKIRYWIKCRIVKFLYSYFGVAKHLSTLVREVTAFSDTLSAESHIMYVVHW